MKYKSITISVLTVLVLGILSGCSLDAQRKQSANRQWQRTIEQARLEAAEESIANGQLAYAEQILKHCLESNPADSVYANQAQQMLARIESEHYHIAQVHQDQAALEEQVY